ncbi:hypothetical protein [Pseudomonas alkylphenolica]|uniref:hypothetical protein n=1 Tax=Pseudomonas alkylphenolica TaxID=237609 RepID=UPI0018D6D1DB|nr:hypothetical protein [Pseudomonas alkylphenolica]MBH3426180.1 hypothetical protein [Pseudomonas alkylphenolica]
MKQVFALAKQKPRWIPNEGYWRILQIVRLAAFVPLALFGLACIVAGLTELTEHYSSRKDLFAMGLLFLAASMLAFVAVHGTAWMIVWVIEGFSE